MITIVVLVVLTTINYNIYLTIIGISDAKDVYGSYSSNYKTSLTFACLVYFIFLTFLAANHYFVFTALAKLLSP